MSNPHEEEALGKAYDSRLMRRLLQYLRPYKAWVFVALGLAPFITWMELSPPYLFQVAIDRYFVPAVKGAVGESQAWHGIWIITGIYFGVLLFDFLAQY